VSHFRRNAQTDHLSLKASGIISLRNLLSEAAASGLLAVRLLAVCRRVAFQDPDRTFMHPCGWNAVNREWCKAVHNSACQRFSQKRLGSAQLLGQAENISGCRHVLICRYKLYRASETKRLWFCFMYRCDREPTALLLLKSVFCGRLCGSWKCRMWEIKNATEYIVGEFVRMECHLEDKAGDKGNTANECSEGLHCVGSKCGLCWTGPSFKCSGWGHASVLDRTEF